jgi:hypothetical protein
MPALPISRTYSTMFRNVQQPPNTSFLRSFTTFRMTEGNRVLDIKISEHSSVYESN